MDSGPLQESYQTGLLMPPGTVGVGDSLCFLAMHGGVVKLNAKEKTELAGVLRDAEDLAALYPTSLRLPRVLGPEDTAVVGG